MFFGVYLAIILPKKSKNSSAIKNNFITLSLVAIAIIVCLTLCLSTIKLQLFSLMAKFISSYNSSN